jgi:hypothetical protein
MNVFLKNLLEKTGKKPAIVIVITKADKMRDRSEEGVIKDVKYLFSPLFVKDEGWLVAICPVTLGNELDTDPNTGKIDPENVHYPVTFAIYHALRQEAESARRSREEKQNDADRLARERDSANFLTKIGNRLFHQDKLEEQEREINASWRQANMHYEKMQEAGKNLSLLCEELLKDIPVYYGGKEVKIE